MSYNLNVAGDIWSNHANKSANLFERLGYDNFMSHLIHGFLFERKNDVPSPDDLIIHKEYVLYIPGDITKLIALYSPVINQLFIKTANDAIDELKEVIQNLAQELSRKNQSLLNALEGLQTLADDQQSHDDICPMYRR